MLLCPAHVGEGCDVMPLYVFVDWLPVITQNIENGLQRKGGGGGGAAKAAYAHLGAGSPTKIQPLKLFLRFLLLLDVIQCPLLI